MSNLCSIGKVLFSELSVHLVLQNVLENLGFFLRKPQLLHRFRDRWGRGSFLDWFLISELKSPPGKLSWKQLTNRPAKTLRRRLWVDDCWMLNVELIDWGRSVGLSVWRSRCQWDEVTRWAQLFYFKSFNPKPFFSSLPIAPYTRHRLGGRPSGRFPSRGYHSVTWDVHRSSARRASIPSMFSSAFVSVTT